MSEARIGPHLVKRLLVVGPGLELAEAEDPSGIRILLQLLRLRSPGDEELDALRKLERRIAKVTTSLFEAFSISTHAGVDLSDGTRMLFWALPWPRHPFFDLERGRRLSEAETLETARLLIERARRLAALGLHDPALYEGALLVTSAGVPCDVAGLPLSTPRGWLHRTEPAPRTLPEEDLGDYSVEGDLFRIASVLAAIAAPGSLSSETRVLLAKLSDRVYADLGAALDAVRRRQESLLEATGLARKSEPAPSQPMPPAELPAPVQAPAGPDWGAMFGDLDDTEIPSAAAETVPPRREFELAETAPPSVAPQVRPAAPPVAVPVPPAAAPVLVPPAAAPVAVPPTLGLERSNQSALQSAIDSVVEPYEEEPVWADADLLSDPGGRPSPVREDSRPRASASTPDAVQARHPGAGASAVTVPLEAAAPPTLGPEPTVSNSSSVVQALAAQKAAWAPPVFAEGASPWSEIVETQGAHRRASGQFPGYEESLPGLAPEAIGPAPIAPMPVAPPPVVVAPVATRPVEPLAPLLERPTLPVARGAPKLLVVVVVVVLVLLGALAAFMRGMPEPIDALPSLVAGPSNQVSLDSQPSGAKVVAEADGHLLGRTPMDFLVPAGANPVVLVVARGFEPQRVVLPDRGALEIRLLTLPANALCEVELVAETDVKLEGLEVELSDQTVARVPGSMVVRAALGQSLAGARLVRCPELGGRKRMELRFDKRWAPAMLRVTAPPGATVHIDGQAAGTVPVTHRTGAAFAQVRVEDEKGRALERWVPSRTETELAMPAPESRALDVKAGELPDDVDAAGESEEPGQIDPIIDEEKGRTPVRRAKKLSRADRERVSRLLREGNRLLLSGQVARAQVAFETCLKIDEGTAACHRSLGTLHRRQNDEKGAKEHLSRYVELAPDAPDLTTIRRILKSLD